jgi:carbonic anhydrase/acetyltransferase-like protein (isoleucine patch superfamily)
MAPKTLAQMQSDWVVRGTIAKVQAQLDREPDAGKRKSLEDVLAQQRKLISPS